MAIPTPKRIPAINRFEAPSPKANVSPPTTIATRAKPRAMVVVNAVINTFTAFSQGEAPAAWAYAGAASTRLMATMATKARFLRSQLRQILSIDFISIPSEKLPRTIERDEIRRPILLNLFVISWSYKRRCFRLERPQNDPRRERRTGRAAIEQTRSNDGPSRASRKDSIACVGAINRDQTPRNSSAREILKATAIFSMFMSETLRSPRSMPPMYVRSSPQMSAKASWDTPSFCRLLRTALASRIRTSSGLTVDHIWNPCG